MNSLVLQTAARFLASLLVMTAIFLVLRGHDAPGGGFAGGLMASAAFVLYALAVGPDVARDPLRIPAEVLMGVGLLIALVSGLIGWFAGDGFLVGQWATISLGEGDEVKLGTPQLFDVGVALVVVGVVQAIFLRLMGEE